MCCDNREQLLDQLNPTFLFTWKGTRLKDEERYAKEAGKLMLFLAAGSLVMTVLLYFQVIAAVVQIVVWIIVFGILWKKMDERYGA